MAKFKELGIKIIIRENEINEKVDKRMSILSKALNAIQIDKPNIDREI